MITLARIFERTCSLERRKACEYHRKMAGLFSILFLFPGLFINRDSCLQFHKRGSTPNGKKREDSHDEREEGKFFARPAEDE